MEGGAAAGGGGAAAGGGFGVDLDAILVAGSAFVRLVLMVDQEDRWQHGLSSFGGSAWSKTTHANFKSFAKARPHSSVFWN